MRSFDGSAQIGLFGERVHPAGPFSVLKRCEMDMVIVVLVLPNLNGSQQYDVRATEARRAVLGLVN